MNRLESFISAMKIVLIGLAKHPRKMSFSAVVVAQLAAGLLPTPEIHILNEAIRNFFNTT